MKTFFKNLIVGEEGRDHGRVCPDGCSDWSSVDYRCWHSQDGDQRAVCLGCDRRYRCRQLSLLNRGDL